MASRYDQADERKLWRFLLEKNRGEMGFDMVNSNKR
jgi:hypothetical protein